MRGLKWWDDAAASEPRAGADAWISRADAGRSAFRRRRQIPNLDGLRAISILMVLFFHVGHADFEEAFFGAFHANGRFGVSVFFVVSGFLIATLILREIESRGAFDLLRFWARRSLRLFPLYYIVLVIYLGLIVLTDAYSPAHEAVFWDKLPSFVFYFSNLRADATVGPFFHSWSLAAEEQFYFVFGLLVLFLPKRWIVRVCLVAVLLKLALIGLAIPASLSASLGWRIVFSYEEAILYGVLLAFLLESRSGFRLFHRLVARPSVLLGLVLSCVALLATSTIDSKHGLAANALYFGVAAIIGVLAIGPPRRALSHPGIVWIGRVSYGMYLFHMLVLNTVKQFTLSPWPRFCIGTLATIALASVSYLAVEAPLLALRKRLRPKPVA